MKYSLIAKLKYLLPLLILAACDRNRGSDETPPSLYRLPQTFEANPDGGYTLNPITGDTIQPLVNSMGDTIPTGVPILATGKVIQQDSVMQPKNFPVPPQEQLTKINPHSNVHVLPEKLTVISINKDSLTKILLRETPKNDTSHYLINATGSSIKTGSPTPARGKIVKTNQPQLRPALPPRFKDNTIKNMKYLDVNQGMTSSYINSILEDKNGNLWFGSWGGGVSMYNGKSFTHFTEKEGLSNNDVMSILEDKNGNLWLGTYEGGISMYNGEFFTRFSEKEGFSNNGIMSSLEDKDGNLWFGTYGGGVSMYNGESFTHFTKKEGLSNNNIRAILEDKNGNLWFGTWGGGVSMYDGESFTHFTEKEGLSNNNVWSILEDKDGNLWFGTYGGGVSMYNGESFTHFTEKEGLSHNYVPSILEDKDGNLWFGTWGGGVSMYNGRSFTHFTEKDGLSSNHVPSMLEDKNGNLWFGTYGGGVSIYKGGSFAHFTRKEGLSHNYVLSILEDKKENLWFGTFGGGVNMYNGESFMHFTEKDGLSDKDVMSILEDKNENLWFGTYGGGVSKYDGESFTRFTEKEGLSSNNIRSLLEDKNGNLWFGSYEHGVSMYNGEFFTHFTEKEGLSNNNVWSMLEDKNGNLWFGTYGGGVSKYDGESFTHFTEKEGLSNNFVMSLLEDKNGNLWFGTYGGGVNMYNGESFTHFSEKEGLSNNFVMSLLEDKNGNLWLGTENGIDEFVVVDKVDKQPQNDQITITAAYRPICFIKNDGLKGLDFYLNSAYLDSKNRMWWGSGKSLTTLDMNKYSPAQYPPAVYLKQLDINEQYIDYRNISSDGADSEITFNGVQRFENYPLDLELPFDKNHLTFHFAAIDWSAPHKIQYSCIIEGLNTTWSRPSYDGKADYRNLPHGTYTFKVCAIGESGQWSDPCEQTFTIHPPWWHTWWARTGYVLVFLLSIFGTIRWRTAKLKQRKRELEIEVEVATKEIREQKNEAERQRDEVRKQKEVVEEAHKEIKDSINYAKRIQNAILPPQKLIKEYLPESFIIYRPKDVVAGDFYWMEHIDGKVLFAVADCTGHGVPGAMVSVVCNNGLNRSVRELRITEPGKILDKTREIVIQEFEKSEEDVKDGMDIALCSLEGNKVKFAGAHNPLWIIRKDAAEIEEINGDRQPIGKFGAASPFSTHQVLLNNEDSIYIFSDGFADQFGGEKGKKIKAKNFKKLLLSIQNESMDDQKELIDKAFEKWRGNLDQLDDVCVIGLRVKSDS